MEDVVGVLVIVAVVLIFFFILVLLFKWLWNITMPEVFGINPVTFWQAFRILILASILFGGHRTFQQGADMGAEVLDEDIADPAQ